MTKETLIKLITARKDGNEKVLEEREFTPNDRLRIEGAITEQYSLIRILKGPPKSESPSTAEEFERLMASEKPLKL
jgi:hypothetical protein